MLAAHSSNETH